MRRTMWGIWLIASAFLLACGGATTVTDSVPEAAEEAASMGSLDTTPMPEEIPDERPELPMVPAVVHWEIMSHDAAALTAFYAELFGWEITTWEEGEAPYHLVQSGGEGYGIAGGIGQIPEGDEWPAYLSVYVLVMDLDARLDLVRGNGGTVAMEPMEIPSVGTIAMVLDPNGAMVGLMQPSMGDEEPPTVPSEHPVVHWEIGSLDGAAAQTFFSATFGWEFHVDPEQNYAGVEPGVMGAIGGGIMQVPEGRPGYVTFYVAVEDLQVYLDRAVALGATSLLPPTHIMEGVDIAMFLDLDGNEVGLFLMDPATMAEDFEM